MRVFSRALVWIAVSNSSTKRNPFLTLGIVVARVNTRRRPSPNVCKGARPNFACLTEINCLRSVGVIISISWIKGSKNCKSWIVSDFKSASITSVHSLGGKLLLRCENGATVCTGRVGVFSLPLDDIEDELKSEKIRFSFNTGSISSNKLFCTCLP